MSEEKLKIIKNSTDEYKKLPKDKQMFVLGFMQGVLSSYGEKQDNKGEVAHVSDSDTGRR